ncbi:hypothetical protein [Lentilactobacillus hilgardii]|uniref:hypothetical protein n=1 Tax=Lentilactobacillus hilgardii TaxID=1588 RepID=UPI003FA5A86D
MKAPMSIRILLGILLVSVAVAFLLKLHITTGVLIIITGVIAFGYPIILSKNTHNNQDRK